MERGIELLQVFSHHRHEILNYMQLMKAYRALGKEERLDELINEIVYTMEQENKLLNMKLEQLFLLLTMYPIVTRKKYELTYEVMGPVLQLPTFDAPITIGVQKLFQTLEQLTTGETFTVHVTIDTQTSPTLYIDVSCPIRNPKLWVEQIRNGEKQSNLAIGVHHIDENSCTLTIPFNNITVSI